MSVIDQIVAHYAANKDQFIDVPEWGPPGQPLRIHWQLLTIEKRRELSSAGAGWTDVDTLIALARDGDGKPMFTLEDKPKLKLTADAVIITRVAARMVGLGRLTEEAIEAAEKN